MSYYATLAPDKHLRFKFPPQATYNTSGFKLLHTTRDEVVQLLLKADTKIQALMAEDVLFALGRECLGNHEWSSKIKLAEERELISRGLALLKELPAYEANLQNLAIEIGKLCPPFAEGSWQELLTRIRANKTSPRPLMIEKMNPWFLKIEDEAHLYKQKRQEILTFCTIPAVFQSYLLNGLAQNLDLGYVAALYCAQQKSISLRLWQQCDSQLIPVQVDAFPSLPQPSIDYLWDPQDGHFYPLQEIPPPAVA